jgi:hypothetical protein
LLLQVGDEAKEKGIRKDDPELDKTLVDGLQGHLTKLEEHQENIKVELEAEEKEQTKKITSDDLHEGFDSKASQITLLVGDADRSSDVVRSCKAITTSCHCAPEKQRHNENDRDHVRNSQSSVCIGLSNSGTHCSRWWRRR